MSRFLFGQRAPHRPPVINLPSRLAVNCTPREFISFKRALAPDFSRNFLSMLFVVCTIGSPAYGAVTGVNDFYLAQQYLGLASRGDGSERYRKVEVAMANKAMQDAAVNGAAFIRFSATGYKPSLPGQAGDLDLWSSSPDKYWEHIDELTLNLDQHALKAVVTFVWNWPQFPAMTNESVRDLIVNPNSKSYLLATKYIEQFVQRYKGRKTILFYELTNELNLGADLDLAGRCRKSNAVDQCVTSGNFTTDEMIEFCRRISAVIRKADPGARLSSGFSLPRRAAEHIRARPEWVTGKTDFTPDSAHEFEKNLTEIHSMVDIIGVHIYPDSDGGENSRFGDSDIRSTALLDASLAAAKRASKPLYVGEYGDTGRADSDDSSMTIRMMNRIAELKPEYSSPWVWEFYPRNTFQTHDTSDSKDSMEPGFTDHQIARFRKLAADFGHPRPAMEELRKHSPNLVLSWPLDCTVLGKTQLVHALASDDADRVITVSFYIDNKKLAELHNPPYEKEFSTAGLSAGMHSFKTQAEVPGSPNASVEVRVVVGADSTAGSCH